MCSRTEQLESLRYYKRRLTFYGSLQISHSPSRRDRAEMAAVLNRTSLLLFQAASRIRHRGRTRLGVNHNYRVEHATGHCNSSINCSKDSTGNQANASRTRGGKRDGIAPYLHEKSGRGIS